MMSFEMNDLISQFSVFFVRFSLALLLIDQCSNGNCCVAYHPLRAHAAGFYVELEDEDRLNLIPLDEDEESQSIRLLSYCKRHRSISHDGLAADEQIGPKLFECSAYTPPEVYKRNLARRHLPKSILKHLSELYVGYPYIPEKRLMKCRHCFSKG